mgnify:CR=1 FL=1
MGQWVCRRGDQRSIGWLRSKPMADVARGREIQAGLATEISWLQHPAD